MHFLVFVRTVVMKVDRASWTN